MIYVNAGTKAGIPAWLTISMRALYMMIFILFILFGDNMLLENNFKLSMITPSVQLVITFLLAITIAVGLFNKKFDYISKKVNVEITEEGLWNNYPGEKINFAWLNLESAKIVEDKIGLKTIEVFWKDKSFVFHSLLLQENSTDRRLRFFPSATEDYQISVKKFLFYVWEDVNTGKRFPVTLVHSTGYNLLQKYRPDLFDKLTVA